MIQKVYPKNVTVSLGKIANTGKTAPAVVPPQATPANDGKPTRRQAREVAMQVLYMCDLNDDANDARIADYIHERLNFPPLEAFARRLIAGVRAQLGRIDDELAASAENWSVRRMAAVDRNILRLATYELRGCPDVPPKVAINEALEICKRYSSAESVPFVNGILDRIANSRPAAALAKIS